MRKSIQRGFLFIVPVALAALALAGLPFVQAQSNPSADCAPGNLAAGWPETDFCNASVDLTEILSGGVPRDGIPAVTDPIMESVEDAGEWLVDQSPVIAIEIDGDARAYPQALLTWHEIANDTVGDVPVAVTFCPLCNSSIVFDRRVDGNVLEFGVSGKLRNSDMVMYDRNTDSWWQQFTGEGIVGFYNESVLDIIPSVVVGFGQFAERYPDGLVMSRDTGFSRSYGANPYVGYDQNSNPFLFSGPLDNRLPAAERVLGSESGDEAVAYPFAQLSVEIVVNDVLDGEAVVAFWQPGVASALDQRQIDESRDIGTAALYERTVDGQELTFSWTGEQLVDDQTGSVWNLFGEATEGELAGTQLRQRVAAPHFWFAWAAFHPNTTVYAGAEATATE